MLSAAYSVATWAEYVFAAVAVIAIGAVSVRSARRSGERILAPLVVFVVAGSLCLGSFYFLRTRVVELKLDSIKEVGLEIGHAGLRTNALRYDTHVSVTASLRVPGALGQLVNSLVHKTTSVSTDVAVYGLIDFTTVNSRTATVDRESHTITLSLPDPAISKDTAYIASVNGVQEQDGTVTAVVSAVAGVVRSIFHLPVVSVNPAPELALAETRAIAKARHSAALASCGKQEIAEQLNGIFHLLPAYRDYTVVVRWPQPPDPNINCAALQRN